MWSGQRVQLAAMVLEPKRESHILHLIFTNTTDSLYDVRVVDNLPGTDHDAVLFSTNYQKHKPSLQKRWTYIQCLESWLCQLQRVAEQGFLGLLLFEGFHQRLLDQFQGHTAISDWPVHFQGHSPAQEKNALPIQRNPSHDSKKRERASWLNDLANPTIFRPTETSATKCEV